MIEALSIPKGRIFFKGEILEKLCYKESHGPLLNKGHAHVRTQ
jgi:hypothetical protein